MRRMPGTFSPPQTSKETACERSRYASRHVRDARAVMHVVITKKRWRGKRSRHSRYMRNPQFYVSGKRPMENTGKIDCYKTQGIAKHVRLRYSVSHHSTKPGNRPLTCCNTVLHLTQHNLHKMFPQWPSNRHVPLSFDMGNIKHFRSIRTISK